MELIVVCFLGISGFKKKAKSIVKYNMVFSYDEHLVSKLRILDWACIMAEKIFYRERDFK